MDIAIHDKPVRVVLDTGADMSVLPRDVLLQLLPNIHLKPPTQVAQAFSGQQLLLEGPYHLMVTICQYTFCHPFYALDDHDPTIVGMDFINAAQLVIDCRQGYVWSYYNRGTTRAGVVNLQIIRTDPSHYWVGHQCGKGKWWTYPCRDCVGHQLGKWCT